ncbi:YidH family protein [Altererythrobacter sp. MF3-039]|uniref:YidH family protein n=1 Tax=Altererythrobacter sp. MF3-039 TaxID=3252901 RepID=UPI00390C5786
MADSSKDSNELAEDRTDWAEDRTILALERTFAGWMRTAFAAIAIGIGFRALFGEFDPPWLAKAIATMFISLAIVFAIGAERRACRSFERLSSHAVDSPQLPRLRWIAYSISFGAALLIVALWVLNDGQLSA